MNTSEMIDSDILDYFDEPNEEPKKEIIIGIDLGTSNSCCSYWDDDHYVMIPDENGNFLFPSIITFDDKDNIYSCNEAKKHIINNNYFYETKRLIGRNFSDEFIQKEKKYLTYDISTDETDKIFISKTINNKTFKLTPEEVSSYVLSSIKQSAEEFLKQEVKECVITVPAYFNEAQKQATRNAALIAGLDCKMILCEPVASAFAYGIIHKDNYNILVYDFGGGTLDVSLLKITDNVFEVVETSGNMHIGGLDFDKIIFNYCISVFKQNNKNFNFKKLSNLKQKELLSKAEQAKKELSDKLNTIIKIDNFYENKKLLINLTRNKFEELSNQLLLISMTPINKIFENKTLNIEDINEVILVGGMTRMPMIQQNIKSYFNKQPNTSMNPDYIVGIGAGIQGYLLSNPDAELSQSIILLNTTALSIGLEVQNEFMDVLIPRSTIIPYECKRTYTNQKEDDKINIKLFEGERKLTKDNFLIGEFSIQVKPQPPGTHKICISIKIDLDNKILVSATNLLNGESKELIINVKDKQLSKDEIKQIIENANKYKIQDKMNKKMKKNYNDLMNILNTIDKNQDKLRELNIDFDINVIEEIKSSINSYTLKDLKECIELLKPIATMIITKDTNLKIDYSDIKDNLTSINGNIIEKNKGSSVYQDDKISGEKEINIDDNIESEDNEELINNINKLEDYCSSIIEYLDDIIDNNEIIESKDNEEKLKSSFQNNSMKVDYFENNKKYKKEIKQLIKKKEKLLCSTILTDDDDLNDEINEINNKINQLENQIVKIDENEENEENDEENEEEKKKITLIKSKNELYDYINNILLYLHISNDLSNESINKILNDIENKYNDFMALYNKINNISKYDELIILCNSLLNVLNADETNNILTEELKDTINNVLSKQKEDFNDKQIDELLDKIQDLSEKIVNNE